MVPLTLFLAQVLFSQSLPASPVPVSEAGVAVEALNPKGEPLRNPKAEDFTVSEGGEPRRVLGVEPLGEAKPWRLVIYVDRVLSGTRTVRGAAGALAARSEDLVKMGTVEVVVAEPEPMVVLPPTRDAKAVDEALSRLLLASDGRDDLRVARQRFTEELGEPTSPKGEDLAERVEEAVEFEARLVGTQQDLLLGWLAEQEKDEGGPRALFLVSDGFDRDPAELYLSRISDAGARATLAPALAGYRLDTTVDEVARTTAELGWIALPMPVGDEKLPELRRWRVTPSEEVPIAVTVPLGKRKKKEPEAPPGPPLLLNPKEPLQRLAEATGGELLPGSLAVPAAIARLRSRLWLRYESALPAAARALEVRSAVAESKVKARRWTGLAIPQGIAAMRARRLLSGGDDFGELPVSSTWQDGVLEVRVETPEPVPGARLTLAVPAGAVGLTLSHRDLTSAEATEDGAWRVPVPEPAGERLVVMVEDPARALWGGEVVAIRTAETEAAVGEPVADEASAESVRASWSGKGVRIVRPASGKGTGPVDVEVELRLPPGRRLDRLELYWNDQLTATLYKPPFLRRVPIPPAHPVGTLKAVASLDDGSRVEDAVLMNSSVLGERVDVRLVELFVVVTDRAGKPVRGLSRGDFRLLQDGREQSIASFDEAGDFPLTLGLAMDSSASMFVKLPGVQVAAESLLRQGLSKKDSALLVDFDSEPRLLIGPTRDLAAVAGVVETLTADGGSDLFEAITFSLGQLRNISGRKALVAYSDGVEEGEGGYRSCLRAARQSGIPVYLIVTNPQAARGEPVGSYAGQLDKLAAATGGKAYFVLPSQDLSQIYDEILRELRSQYLLAFYPNENGGEAWRSVDVEVRKPGFQARTLSGYEPEAAPRGPRRVGEGGRR